MGRGFAGKRLLFHVFKENRTQTNLWINLCVCKMNKAMAQSCSSVHGLLFIEAADQISMLHF